MKKINRSRMARQQQRRRIQNKNSRTTRCILRRGLDCIVRYLGRDIQISDHFDLSFLYHVLALELAGCLLYMALHTLLKWKICGYNWWNVWCVNRISDLLSIYFMSILHTYPCKLHAELVWSAPCGEAIRVATLNRLSRPSTSNSRGQCISPSNVFDRTSSRPLSNSDYPRCPFARQTAFRLPLPTEPT